MPGDLLRERREDAEARRDGVRARESPKGVFQHGKPVG
jgi:hypothetical protein